MWGRPAMTFVNAAVIAPDGRLADAIRLRGGRVDRLGGEPARGDLVLDAGGAVIAPGLVNAHDHLELNSFARMKWRPRYANVREWIEDFQPRFATDPLLAAARPDTLADRAWVGGLKNLLSGVTTVCHHNPVHRVLQARFPVRIVRRFGLSHSLQIDGDAVADACRATPPDRPWIIHAAEGTDAEARREIARLETLGCLGPNTVLVHGVGIDGLADRVIAAGASLVWCPTSNEFLFGQTADVRRFAAAQRLAIGSDSRLSGAGDLLDELRAADATGQIPADALVRAVTLDAAAMLREPRLGRLEPGGPADLTVFDRVAPDPFETIVRASRARVRLVMRDGEALVADDGLRAAFGTRANRAAPARVDGAPRWLAPWIARRAAQLAPGEPGLEVTSSW